MKLFIPKVFQYYPLVKVGFGRGGFLHYFFPFQDLDDSKRHLDDDGGGEGGRRIPSVLPWSWRFEMKNVFQRYGTIKIA